MNATPPGPNVLRSARVVLREMPLREVEDLLDGRGIPSQSWAKGYPLEGTLSGGYLRVCMVENNAYRWGFGMYQVVDRHTDQVIGDIGFHSEPGDDGAVEIGYGIVAGFRGRGFATEAVRTLTTWALGQPGVTAIKAEAVDHHVASQAVLTRAGFDLVDTTGGTHRYTLRGVPAT